MAFRFLKLIAFRWPKCHFCIEAKPCTCELAQILLGAVATSPVGHLPAVLYKLLLYGPPSSDHWTLQWKGTLFRGRKHKWLPRAWISSLHPVSSLERWADSRWFLLTQSQSRCNAETQAAAELAAPGTSEPLSQGCFRGKTSVELSYLSSSILTEINLSL